MPLAINVDRLSFMKLFFTYERLINNFPQLPGSIDVSGVPYL